MPEERLPRKLAAILYADVAGYSRLTGDDEDATHRRLSDYLDLISSHVARHHGRVMHYAGDAALATFDAAVDALSCAAHVQRELQRRNDELPDERKLRFRIGLNLGDVIEDRGDVYGDGVNVAARLESLAEPGGICISESVHTAVGAKLPLAYEYIGEQAVKNIAKPVRAYHARVKEGTTLPGPSAAIRSVSSRRGWWAAALLVVALTGGLLTWLGRPAPPYAASGDLSLESMLEKPSVAVLPFHNLNDDAAQDYFADGMTDDLITDLTKISGLFIIARDSTFAYKGQTPDVRELGQALKVGYVVRGSVRRLDDTVRINAQLMDAANGRQMWAERYDGDIGDIFKLQDEITEEIVSTLSVTLASGERDELIRDQTDSPQAYELYLRARERFYRFSKDDTLVAQPLLERAIVLDPEFAPAYALLGWTRASEAMNGWSEDRERSLAKSQALAEKAIALSPSTPLSYFVTGLVHRERGDWTKALAELEKATAIDPNYANAHVLLASLLYYDGRPEEGLERMKIAIRLNPRHPTNYPFHLGQAYFILQRYDEAIAAFREGLDILPSSERLRVWLAATYAQAGLIDDAEWEIEEVLMMNPDFSLQTIAEAFPFKSPDDRDHFLDGLRKAGAPGG